MGYTGVPYVIKSGDTLWDIAAEKLGDPYAWSQIYAFNNEAEVIRAGATRIVDPDLIYAGSTLMLPLPPGVTPPPMPSATRGAPNGSLKDQIPNIQMPLNIAYDLKGDPIVLDYGSFVARVRLKGRVLLQPAKKLPLTVVMNGGYEVSAKMQADTAFSKLISNNTVSFDPNSKSIKFSNKLITSANNVYAVKTAIGIEASSTSGMPVLKGEIIYPELKGMIGTDAFVAVNLKVEIEIEPRKPIGLQPIPVPVYEPVPSPTRAPQTDWGYAMRNANTEALVLAGLLTVGFGLAIYFSGGLATSGSGGYATAMSVILVGGTVSTIAVQ